MLYDEGLGRCFKSPIFYAHGVRSG